MAEEGSKNYDATRFQRPSVTVDIVIFTVRDDQLNILLIKRKVWPFKGEWALPGGFVRIDESLDDAAKRELREETNVKNVYLEQLYTFGDVNRDPRTRVISTAHYALINSKKIELYATTDAEKAQWFPVNNMPKLAFDHDKIVNCALNRIRNKIEYTNIAFRLLPKKFTLTELQKVYEIILNKKLDKRNFRKKVKSINLIKDLKETQMEGAHRPAKLYSFKKESEISILSAEKRI